MASTTIDFFDNPDMNAIQNQWLGKLVYEAYTPSRLWKIVKIVRYEPGPSHCPELGDIVVILRNIKGEVRETTLTHYNDYEVLCSDHERKAKNHRERQAKAIKDIPNAIPSASKDVPSDVGVHPMQDVMDAMGDPNFFKKTWL